MSLATERLKIDPQAGAARPAGGEHRAPRSVDRTWAAVAAVKLFLGATCASAFLASLFVPFLNFAVLFPGDNPWQRALEAGLPKAFPYGPVMYVALVLPRWLLAWALPGGAFNVTWLHLLAARLPLLLADAAVWALLVRAFGAPARRTAWLWWASPVVLYVSYVHGQLDLIPTAFLMLSLALLDRGRWAWAAVCLGLGIAAKSHLVIALPFMAVFAGGDGRRWRVTAAFAAMTATAWLAAMAPCLGNPAFRAMVLGTDEQLRMFQAGLEFQPGLRVFLAPLAVWLLFLRFVVQRRVSRDALFMFLGLAYLAMIGLLPPAHGYYIWPLPFIIYFFAARPGESAAPLWAFNGSCLAYLLLGLDSTLFDSLRFVLPAAAGWPAPVAWAAQALGAPAQTLDSLLFTLLEGSLLVLAVRMYRFGVSNRIIHSGRLRPVLIGIGGDSGSGKHTARDLFADLLGPEHALSVDGDDAHRWERGHPMYEVLSHLSPAANDLHLQLRHAQALGEGRIVTTASYNHATGRFSDVREVSPKRFVFFVGLHPFYLRGMRTLLDLRVFMDPEEELRQGWKLRRDVRHRGYAPEAVREQLERREPDAERFIRPQHEFADLVVRYSRLPAVPDDTRLGVALRFPNDASRVGLLAEWLAAHGAPSARIHHEYGLVHQALEFAGELTPEAVEAAARALFGEVLRAVGSAPAWRANHNGMVQLAFLCLLADLLPEREGML